MDGFLEQEMQVLKITALRYYKKGIKFSKKIHLNFQNLFLDSSNLNKFFLKTSFLSYIIYFKYQGNDGGNWSIMQPK